MNRQGVIIKGNSEGITVFLNEECDFSVILSDLREKFINSNNFFKGASIFIYSGKRNISADEKMSLINLCQEFELSGVEFVNKPLTLPHKVKDPFINDGKTMIFKKTIRSGQKVAYKGNIVVIGDVNPGAEVIASGDVVVMGYLRGVVHAGAQGNTEAEVYALSLQPTQLRIAHCIARPPDDLLLKKKSLIEPERAYIKDGLIIIESIED